MKLRFAFVCRAMLFAVLAASASRAAATDTSRRLFDFTPVSPTNPVVATIDHSIQIPLSELRAYQQAERLHAITDPSSLAQKRAVLDELVTEYLFVDAAYRSGVTDLPGFKKQFAATRTMLLTDFLAARLEARKPKSETDPVAALGDRLFDAAPIDISNEAFALVQQAGRKIDATRAAAQRGPVRDSAADLAQQLRAIVRQMPNVTLARYPGHSIFTRELVAIYAGMPPPRPAIETQAGLVAMIKPLIVPELLAAEAEKEGIAADPAFQDKLVQNRNVLLRFHEQGLVEHEANEQMQGPDFGARLESWFRLHQRQYAPVGAKDGDRLPTFAEARARAESDYSVDLVEQLRHEKAAELRAHHTISIDEAALKRL